MNNILPRGIVGSNNGFNWPTLRMTPEKIVALTRSLQADGVQYALGAKAEPLTLQAGQFDHIDCSGFVRWAIYHATLAEGPALTIPDGSYNQHAWVERQGFKLSDYKSGRLADGRIRIAFLSPEDGGGIGHVMLIVDGFTCESHGSHGPDRRPWGSQPFMPECSLYVLT